MTASYIYVKEYWAVEIFFCYPYLMNKNAWLAILVIVAIGLGAYAFMNKQYQPVFNPLSVTYSVEGQSVTLIDGKLEVEAAPVSASKIVTMVFGEPVAGDLNGDRKADAAIILTQNSGGSGTFYYVVAALSDGNGAKGTNAVLLGDRIAPQNIEIKNGQIIANYADRKLGEPMTAAPSVGVSKYLVYDGTELREVAP